LRKRRKKLELKDPVIAGIRKPPDKPKVLTIKKKDSFASC
jgi:hypothetical protein